MANLTRRNLLAASATTAGLMGLAACSTTSSTEETDEADTTAADDDPLAAPDASAYPIDPDGEDVEALYTSEELRDGWTRYANEGGATVGVMDTSKVIQVAGLAFKDLNGNGKLDLWEDWRQSAEDRAAALAAELTSDEALALMVHGSVFSAGELTEALSGVGYVEEEGVDPTLEDVFDHGIRTLLNFGNSATAAELARWNNTMQEYVEEKTYGIPVNVSNNPKDYGFPGTLGLAASFDPELARRVAEQESKNYRAEGVSTLLGVQMDLASEPRWSRITGTFGEDPALTRDMTNAYASGLQSTYSASGEDEGWGTDSVINMCKHFPGDGAAEQGREAHNAGGKYNVYPGNNLEAHLIGFVDGGLHLDSKTEQTASFMDSYSIAYTEDEEYGELVATAFSKWKNDLLREKCDYDGLICSDWGVTETPGAAYMATPWGMEDATMAERYEAIIEAGLDQIGGSFELLELKAAYEALVEGSSEDEMLERVRESARRVLRTLYVIGLCDNPYVDSSQSSSVVESDEAIALAEEAVDKSIVMIKNSGVIKDAAGAKPTVYVPQVFSGASEATSGGATGDTGSAASGASWSLPVSQATLEKHFTLVTDAVGEPTGEADADGNATYTESDCTRATADEIAACDFALVFIANPSTGVGWVEADDGTLEYFPVSLQYSEYVADGENVRQTTIAGDLLDDGTRENRSYYGKSTVATNLSDMELVLSTKERVGDLPLVVCVNADRPMCFGEVEPSADTILMGFDADNADFLNIVDGSVEPSGLLPIQMPIDMDAVEAQLEDVPRDMDCYVDAAGNTYDFAFGMDWSGVIDDERVATYKVEPLTKSDYISL